MLPIIGITGRPNEIRSIGTVMRSQVVIHTYSDSVISAGGLPIMLIPVANDQIDDVLDRVDGVLLPGGGDIEARLPRLGRCGRHRALDHV